jgi:3-methylcrotonyl-CoA carboxylase alpha subunit
MNLAAVESRQLLLDERRFEVVIEARADGWHFQCDGRDYRVAAQWIDAQRMRADLDGELVEFAVVQDVAAIEIACQGQTFRFELAQTMHHAEKDSAAAGHPQAPMSGAVVAVPVAVGDRVEVGDALMVIEAMKMEHAIVAQVAATVSEVLCAVGDQVDEGETLVILEVGK